MTMHDEGCGIYVIGRTEAEVRLAGAKLRERLGEADPDPQVKSDTQGGESTSPSILERLGRFLGSVPRDPNIVPLRYWE